MEDCVFCKIAKKEVLAEMLYEDDGIFVIKDIHPKFPVHLLVIPKVHIESIKEIKDEHKELLGKLILIAKKVAEQKNLDFYQLHFNVGRGAGQIIDHIHMHLNSDAVRS
jgi:histidine triad (HIT) family protein